MTAFPYPELGDEKESEYELFPINLTRMMLHTHGQTVPYLKYALSFRHAKITAQLRERVIIRVGAVAGCDYQLVQHKSEALRTGTTPELLAGLIDPERREFGDSSLTALVGYVDSLVANIGAEENALAELRKHFPDNEIAEITLLAGTYVLCASFLKSLGVQPDDGPVKWSAVDAHIRAGRL
ncbi:Putative carboxymuconolactone decarboxylase [Mycolicibacterium phlei]|uniref:carboxymuconolactone decarboxylase family protein n=1 Tax=Mycobacteroides chelonae TaxID=1774 RepID=UPI000618A528|nr:carboxymuconolactone decarboxylase [Mycobacteroides chelonae]ANA99546.1 carboxymuconolactone decarboxylase [Mycobacteroides chelonae CCUG 47445]OLT83138.1 carboxymuconolactone decarboxylase [Mycobacteroides chelonae]ORV16452.1 carboxymuconolactone decarboxylase [Mycobacteroides chelonae]VEG19125.1 Putative carboxymuconolactone decarboxylase [Mycolicibacterium phlei]